MYRLLTNRWTFILLSFLAPLWVLLIRIPFGAIGWLTIILLFAAPVLILLLLALSLLFFFRRDIRRSHHLPKEDAMPLWVLMGALFALGIFLLDFGDTDDSIQSVFTRLMGGHLQSVSGVAEIICLIAAAAAFIWAIAQLIHSYAMLRHHKTIS